MDFVETFPLTFVWHKELCPISLLIHLKWSMTFAVDNDISVSADFFFAQWLFILFAITPCWRSFALFLYLSFSLPKLDFQLNFDVSLSPFLFLALSSPSSLSSSSLFLSSQRTWFMHTFMIFNSLKPEHLPLHSKTRCNQQRKQHSSKSYFFFIKFA